MSSKQLQILIQIISNQKIFFYFAVSRQVVRFSAQHIRSFSQTHHHQRYQNTFKNSWSNATPQSLMKAVVSMLPQSQPKNSCRRLLSGIQGIRQRGNCIRCMRKVLLIDYIKAARRIGDACGRMTAYQMIKKIIYISAEKVFHANLEVQSISSSNSRQHLSKASPRQMSARDLKMNPAAERTSNRSRKGFSKNVNFALFFFQILSISLIFVDFLCFLFPKFFSFIEFVSVLGCMKMRAQGRRGGKV